MSLVRCSVMQLLFWQVTCLMIGTGCVTCILLCNVVVVSAGDMFYDEDRMVCHLYITL